MSSHHFVKDEQEPTLIVYSIKPHQWSIVSQLLEWSPIVIAHHTALEQIIALGHKVDIVIVNKEQYQFWSERLNYQYPLEIEVCEEEFFLKSAMALTQQRGNHALNIITEDVELLSVIGEAAQWSRHFDTVIYSETQRHVLARGLQFKKWLPAFSRISIMPLLEGTYISTEGFDTNLQEEKLGDGIELLKKIEGEVSIRANSVPFLISEMIN